MKQETKDMIFGMTVIFILAAFILIASALNK